MKFSLSLFSSALAALALGLTGCGRSNVPAPAAESTAATEPKDAAPSRMEADLQRTLKEQANFYHVKSPDDFTKDTQGLKWDDGSDLPMYSDPAAKKGGTLNLWIPDFPGTFRAIGPTSNSSFRQYLLDYVSLGIVRAHPSAPGRVGPELAKAWAVDAARKTVYFQLDPDARWSDGVPFTTDDIIFSWYLFRSPLLIDPWLNDFFTKTYTALTVYDAHRFSVTLREMKPDIVQEAGDPSVGMPPYPRHAFKDFGADWVQKFNWRILPTTGAYTIREEDIKRPTSITMTHVKDWWAEKKPFAIGRFNPDRLHLGVIHDADKAFESFVHGDLDVYQISTQNWYSKLPDNNPSVVSGFTVKATFFNQTPPPNYGLWLNLAQAPMDNHDVRLGVYYATNMALVCQQYFRGDAQVQKTASDGYGWDPNPEVKPRPFDPAKAREYFAKAGYTQSGPDGILTRADGQKLALTITTTYRSYQDVLVILKQEALKAGLEFDIEMLDETAGWQKTQDKRHQITLAAFNRTVDVYPRYWENFSGDNAYDKPYLPDGSANPARKIKKSTNNISELADYQLDQLIGQYDRATTMEEIKGLASQIEKRLDDDATWVNGFKMPFFHVGYRPWIKWPADFNPMQALDFEQFWVMWIDPQQKEVALAARAKGEALPKQILIYDKYKQK